MGMQDRDYYREWWRQREAKSPPVAPPEQAEPVAEPRPRPNAMHPFVAWIVLIAWVIGGYIGLLKWLAS